MHTHTTKRALSALSLKYRAFLPLSLLFFSLCVDAEPEPSCLCFWRYITLVYFRVCECLSMFSGCVCVCVCVGVRVLRLGALLSLLLLLTLLLLLVLLLLFACLVAVIQVTLLVLFFFGGRLSSFVCRTNLCIDYAAFTQLRVCKRVCWKWS